jgi:hypothetical protein
MDECRKIRYYTRREARRARRQMHCGHVQAYWHPACRSWHLGRLPLEVLRGLVSRAEVYG